MTDAAVYHVGLHLSEGHLGFDTSPSAVPESFLGSQQLTSFFLVAVQSVVDLYDPPVSLGLVVHASQRTPVTPLCPIAGTFTAISAVGLFVCGADARHVLSHGADEIVLLGIIVEVVVVERIGTVPRALLEMEPVVLYVSLHSGLVHEAVVLLGAVA